MSKRATLGADINIPHNPSKRATLGAENNSKQQKRSISSSSKYSSSKSKDRSSGSTEQQSKFSTASSGETKKSFSTMSLDRKRKKAVTEETWKAGKKKIMPALRVVKAMTKGNKKTNSKKSKPISTAKQLHNLKNTDLMKRTRAEFQSTMDIPRHPFAVNALKRVFIMSSGEQCLKNVVERPHFQDPISVVGKCLRSKNTASLDTLRSTSEGRFRQDVKQEFSLLEHETLERRRRIAKLEMMKAELYRITRNNARELVELQQPDPELKSKASKKNRKTRQRSKSIRKTDSHKRNKS